MILSVSLRAERQARGNAKQKKGRTMNKHLWRSGLLGVLTAILLGIVTRQAAGAEGVPETMQLAVNEQRLVMFAEDVRSAYPSDDKVVALTGAGTRELRVRGLKDGSAIVEYELQSGARGGIAVTVGQPDSRLQEIKAWLDRRLGGIVGVETRAYLNLNVVEIEGTVRLGDVYDRVLSAAEQAQRLWPRQVVNSVNFSPDTALAEEVLVEYLKDNHIVAATASVRPRQVRIGGIVYAEGDLERINQTLPTVIERLRLGDVAIENNIKLDESILEIEMVFFQMGDGVMRELGADLLNNIGLNASGVGKFGDGSPKYTAVLNVELGKVINMLAENGKVENIFSTTITTANGVEGRSQFGETLVFVKRGVDRDIVEEYDVGHILKVIPTLRSGNDISLQVSGEVSELGDYDKEGNARIIKNAFNNTMNLPRNSGMVAAFHKADRWIQVHGGTPILRYIPIVNWVFGKQRFEKTEVYRGFVIIPRLQHRTISTGPSPADQTDDIIRRIRERTAAR